MYALGMSIKLLPAYNWARSQLLGCVRSANKRGKLTANKGSVARTVGEMWGLTTVAGFRVLLFGKAGKVVLSYF